MNAAELQALLLSAQPPTLLHVLPEEVFAAARIPGSVNACVYETAFLDRVKALNVASPIVVYGAGEGSLDASTAAEKLRVAGYAEVQTFDGGLAAWIAAGLPLEGAGQLPQAPVLDGTYSVDSTQSVIRWTGRNPFNHHSGTARLSGGEIHLHQGQLASARFTIDMASVACEDLGDPAMNAMLLAHLRTTDFFDVEHHPSAEFVADAAERIESCTDGTPNYVLRGTFTLRGISRPLEFPVLIAAKDEGRQLTGQGVLDLDRTDYGSHYGSGKFFRYLGQHLVNDHVHLHVKIHTERDSN